VSANRASGDTPALDQLNELAEGRRRNRLELLELWAMTADQRVSAMHRGELSLLQLRVWSVFFPDEVVATSLCGDGELFWILCHTPEYLGDD
jgi:hypothetical protein